MTGVAPEGDVGREVDRLEASAFPDVMVWRPESSASGLWEALGRGWLIKEEHASRFLHLLRVRLTAARQAPAAVATPNGPAAAGPAREATPGASRATSGPPGEEEG